MVVSINLGPQFGYALLSLTLVGLSVIIVGFAFANRIRTQVFNQQFMEQKFGEMHKTILLKEIKEGGYPDSGSGVYSKELEYEDWYRFNNAQRAHFNYVEFISATLIFLFVSAIKFPIASAAIGLAIIISRFIYAHGYTSGGPNGRLVGAIINDILMLGILCLSIVSAGFIIANYQ